MTVGEKCKKSSERNEKKTHCIASDCLKKTAVVHSYAQIFLFKQISFFEN